MQSQLYIKEVKGKGRGVFSAVDINADELIEVCPLLMLKEEEYDLINGSFVMNYCFYYNREKNQVGLAMGYGSLYNHKVPANARHQISREDKTVHIIAVSNIEANEEICINYSGEFDNDSKSWFENRGLVYQP